MCNGCLRHTLLLHPESPRDDCRYTFADFSYLRQADKKRDALEHMEKTVLFLVGAAPLATPDLESAEALGKAKVAAAEEEAARKALEAAEAAAKEAEKVQYGLLSTRLVPYAASIGATLEGHGQRL